MDFRPLAKIFLQVRDTLFPPAPERRHRWHLRWAAIGLCLALFAAAVDGGARADAVPPPAVATLVIETAAGKASFAVEVVDTPAARARGLMGRRHLAADSGMLFDFGVAQPVSMWMKDTHVSLDMIFLDEHGTVIGVATDTVPHALTPIGVGRPVRAVLEVVAGTARRIGLRRGDRIRHPIFASSPATRDGRRKAGG